ncbi:hypothetical protein SCOR_21270 [Sulfidibacter corallicola]
MALHGVWREFLQQRIAAQVGGRCAGPRLAGPRLAGPRLAGGRCAGGSAFRQLGFKSKRFAREFPHSNERRRARPCPPHILQPRVLIAPTLKNISELRSWITSASPSGRWTYRARRLSRHSFTPRRFVSIWRHRVGAQTRGLGFKWVTNRSQSLGGSRIHERGVVTGRCAGLTGPGIPAVPYRPCPPHIN